MPGCSLRRGQMLLVRVLESEVLRHIARLEHHLAAKVAGHGTKEAEIVSKDPAPGVRVEPLRVLHHHQPRRVLVVADSVSQRQRRLCPRHCRKLKPFILAAVGCQLLRAIFIIIVIDHFILLIVNLFGFAVCRLCAAVSGNRSCILLQLKDLLVLKLEMILGGVDEVEALVLAPRNFVSLTEVKKNKYLGKKKAKAFI